MGRRIGIIAGSGEFPVMAVSEIRKRGDECIVAAVRGEADPRVIEGAAASEWVEPGWVSRVVSFFRENGVAEVVMAGKIDLRNTFRPAVLDESALHLLTSAKERTPAAILQAFIDFMARQGVEIINPSFLLEPFFCRAGLLTRQGHSSEVGEDINFGLKIARKVADLEIGQTVAVKQRTIVAVEGLEGTDETLRRAGELAGSGIVAVKVGRTCQDMRIDVPAVGLKTVETLVRAGAAALCVEAEKVAFFQREEAVCLAEAHHLTIVARELPMSGE